MFSLYDYQRAAVDYVKLNNNFALFLDMRLGKSVIITKATKELDLKRILIVAPKTVLPDWKREKLDPEGETSIIANGSVSERSTGAELLFSYPMDRRIWYLTNYQALLNSRITDLPWDLVVIDESVAIKEPRAKITKACTDGFRSAKRRGILSGLPAPEDDLDLFTQFKFLDGEAFGWRNFWQFRANNFFQNERGDWIPNKGVGKSIKEYLHRRAFILSRKDVGIGSKKHYETRYVTMPAELRRLYVAAAKNFAVGEVETKSILTVETWLSRFASGFDPEGKLISEHKINELMYLLDGPLKNEKVVIWGKFDASIKALAERLPEAVVITGAVPLAERGSRMAAFNRDDRRLALLQIKCAQYGIDASGADTAIYFERTWSCNERAQSEDRIVNVAKTSPLLIIDLATEETTDVKEVIGLRDKTFDAKLLLRDLKGEFA